MLVMRKAFWALFLAGFFIAPYLQTEAHEQAHLASAREHGIWAERLDYNHVLVGRHTLDDLWSGYRAELTTWIIATWLLMMVPPAWWLTGASLGGSLGVALAGLTSYDMTQADLSMAAELQSGWLVLCAWWIIPPLLLIAVWRLYPWERRKAKPVSDEVFQERLDRMREATRWPGAARGTVR